MIGGALHATGPLPRCRRQAKGQPKLALCAIARRRSPSSNKASPCPARPSPRRGQRWGDSRLSFTRSRKAPAARPGGTRGRSCRQQGLQASMCRLPRLWSHPLRAEAARETHAAARDCRISARDQQGRCSCTAAVGRRGTRCQQLRARRPCCLLQHTNGVAAGWTLPLAAASYYAHASLALF